MKMKQAPFVCDQKELARERGQVLNLEFNA